MDFIAEKVGSIDCVDSAALLGFAVAQRQPTYTAKIPCQGFQTFTVGNDELDMRGNR